MSTWLLTVNAENTVKHVYLRKYSNKYILKFTYFFLTQTSEVQDKIQEIIQYV